MNFKEFTQQQREQFAALQKQDETAKQNGEYLGRYLRVGFTDRAAFYTIVEETVRKHVLQFSCGESPHPDWNHEVRLFKRGVERAVQGRDKIEAIFPPRK